MHSAALSEKMPGGKRKTVQIRHRMAFDQALQLFAAGEAHCGLFRLSLEDEVAVAVHQIACVRRHGAEESHLHSVPAPCLLSPISFLPKIHE